MDGSAPFASSDLTVSMWPSSAAKCSGLPIPGKLVKYSKSFGASCILSSN